MSEARIELASILSKISALIHSIPTAEQRKASVTDFYNGLRIGHDRYGNQAVSNNLREAAAKADAIIKAELVSAIECDFAEKCVAVANEIESLRVLIPNLAGNACVEIGIIARDIAKAGIRS